jgi:purine-binding chemotaxis protein CheW
MTIDWDEIQRRTAAARAALEEGLRISPARKRAILAARAAALAQTAETEQPAGEAVEVVEFLLADERYGVESSFVREVQPLKEFTPLPATPPFVLGLINLHGEILSVIDIRKFFDLPEKGITDLNKVIVLQNATMQFGILADAVPGARLISLNELQPPLSTFTGVREAYLHGLTRDRLAVLDGGKLLSDPQLVIRDESESTSKSNL